MGPLGASACRGAPQPANEACDFTAGSFNFELPGALPSALGLSEPALGLCTPALGCSWPPLGLLWDSQESLERCFSACLVPAWTNIENLCHYGASGERSRAGSARWCRHPLPFHVTYAALRAGWSTTAAAGATWMDRPGGLDALVDSWVSRGEPRPPSDVPVGPQTKHTTLGQAQAEVNSCPREDPARDLARGPQRPGAGACSCPVSDVGRVFSRRSAACGLGFSRCSSAWGLGFSRCSSACERSLSQFHGRILQCWVRPGHDDREDPDRQ